MSAIKFMQSAKRIAGRRGRKYGAWEKISPVPSPISSPDIGSEILNSLFHPAHAPIFFRKASGLGSTPEGGGSTPEGRRNEMIKQEFKNWKKVDGIMAHPSIHIRNNGSQLKTTPEQIVREFRIADRGVKIEYVKEPVSKLERAIWIFLIFVFGWGFGYFHHFLTTAR